MNAAAAGRHAILRRHASTTQTFSSNVLQLSRKFNRIILIGSVTIIGGITLAVLDYRHTENEAAAHERKVLEISLPTGGPKNLPIALHMTDEKDYETDKPRLVILGTGWGVSLGFCYHLKCRPDGSGGEKFSKERKDCKLTRKLYLRFN